MKKKVKSIRGVGELYPETKQRVTVVLTPTGRDGVDAIAQSRLISRSELIERIGRGLLKVVEP